MIQNKQITIKYSISDIFKNGWDNGSCIWTLSWSLIGRISSSDPSCLDWTSLDTNILMETIIMTITYDSRLHLNNMEMRM